MNIQASIQQIVFPAAVIIYLIWFFMRYRKGQLPREGTFEWIFMRDKPAFSLRSLRKGRMSGRDALIMCAITAVYAVITFCNLGNTASPQSFYAFERGNGTVIIELDEPVKMDTVFYFTGNYHANNRHGYKLYLSPDGVSWTEQTRTALENGQNVTYSGMPQQYSETFRWLYGALNVGQGADTKFIKIAAESFPLELGELVLVEIRGDGERATIPKSRMSMSPDASALFDEPETVPQYYDILNSTHFDEIYHARTSYEFTRGIYPYETTHPPLGKLITAAGIEIFGMTPFGWRFMPALFGVLMLPILYLIIQWMFGKSAVSACGTLIFAFDFMHFVQTRISTIDVYAVFFILLMYMFMLRYITSGYDAPFRKTLPWLALCGLSFGLGAAAKWVCVYAGAGLLALYAVYLFGRARWCRKNEKRFLPFLLLTLGASAAFFILIPGVAYVACYIPYALAEKPRLDGTWIENAKTLCRAAWDECYKNQFAMFKYHGGSVIGQTHTYSSWWYQWLIDQRPICYYFNGRGTLRASVSAFTNPLTAWAGLAALAACGAGVWKRRSAAGVFIIVGFLSQLAPWMAVKRITFAYHYFPSMVFILLAICYVFHRMLEREPGAVKRIYAFTGVALFMFVMFYPILSGTAVPEWYPLYFLKWMTSWTV